LNKFPAKQVSGQTSFWLNKCPIKQVAGRPSFSSNKFFIKQVFRQTSFSSNNYCSIIMNKAIIKEYNMIAQQP
jgi:hypothetical protein